MLIPTFEEMSKKYSDTFYIQQNFNEQDAFNTISKFGITIANSLKNIKVRSIKKHYMVYLLAYLLFNLFF